MDHKGNKFKNETGNLYSRGLFYEEAGLDKSAVLYTLKRDNHEGCVSLYRRYMEIADPTEYRFALACFDSVDHWKTISEASWFQEYVSSWRAELELKIRSEALAAILAASKDGTPNAYHANKYLLEGSWKAKGETKAGRPSKDAIRREAHQIASKAQREVDDYTRVFGHPN